MYNPLWPERYLPLHTPNFYTSNDKYSKMPDLKMTKNERFILPRSKTFYCTS